MLAFLRKSRNDDASASRTEGALVPRKVAFNWSDTPLEWIYRYARQARLVDGADEVHKMVLNRTLDAEETGFWAWDVAGD